MPDITDDPNLPAQIASAIASFPAKLIPSSVKALDRLIGAAVDVPVAWLGQQKAKIDAQTQAYSAVEAAIATTVATEAGASTEIVQQALNVLVRKEYRKQINRQAVSQAAIEDLSNGDKGEKETPDSTAVIDDDWLNVFERYAEDASTERMQNLWGRVLAGEIRKPGNYSMRTLRFLSEFSQADALTFADFCNSAFSDFAPKSLVKSSKVQDISSLVYMESAGLISGTGGLGLTKTLTFRDSGIAFVKENRLAIILRGKPGAKIKIEAIVLTPLGQELLTLLPGRDPVSAAEKFMNAIRTPEITSAYLATIVDDKGSTLPVKIFWQESEQVTATDQN